MPGLDLGLQGRIGFGSGFSTMPNPSTASEAAFGNAYSGVKPSKAAAFAPNDPFGVAFWTGIGCLALLLLIRHSLPA